MGWLRSRAAQEADERLMAATARTGALKIEQLDNLAGLGLPHASSTMSACFAIWHERTRGLAQVSRLRQEADERLMAATARTGALQNRTARQPRWLGTAPHALEHDEHLLCDLAWHAWAGSGLRGCARSRREVDAALRGLVPSK